MKLVYKFKYNGELNDVLMDYCKSAKDLYNQALYLVKKELKSNDKWLSYYELDKILKTTKNLEGDINYYKNKSQVSQQVIKKLSNNITAYIRSIKDWSKNKSKYKGKPKFPKYKEKNGLETLVYTNQSCRIKNDGYLYLLKTQKIKIPQFEKYGSDLMKFNQIHVKPTKGYFEILIVYEKDCLNYDLNQDEYLSIDLGVGNICSVINSVDGTAEIYNGKQIKSINQFYNKEKAKLQSLLETNNKKKTSKRLSSLTEKRNNKINDLLHKTTKHIINQAIKRGIGTIVVGYNRGWKDSIQIGKRNNQTFVSIPHLKLIEILKYKCEMVGIQLITHEESYTSKCDGLVLEKVGIHEVYLGKRVKRGLYQSSCGKLINADINGALNIMRKVVGDSSIEKKIINRGLLFRPKKFKNLFDLIKY